LLLPEDNLFPREIRRLLLDLCRLFLLLAESLSLPREVRRLLLNIHRLLLLMSESFFLPCEILRLSLDFCRFGSKFSSGGSNVGLAFKARRLRTGFA
jgi:hypothetical protein